MTSNCPTTDKSKKTLTIEVYHGIKRGNQECGKKLLTHMHASHSSAFSKCTLSTNCLIFKKNKTTKMFDSLILFYAPYIRKNN